MIGYSHISKHKSVQKTDAKCSMYARVAQMVERDLAKVEAAGSSPVSRSCKSRKSL